MKKLTRSISVTLLSTLMLMLVSCDMTWIGEKFINPIIYKLNEHEPVTVNGKTYRTDFYRGFYPVTDNIVYIDNEITVGDKTFYPLNDNEFDLLYNDCNIYCVEDQIEDIKSYLQNEDNFIRYCEIGGLYSSSDTSTVYNVDDMDWEKYDAIVKFGIENGYDLFGDLDPENGIRITPPGPEIEPIHIYKISKSEVFTTEKLTFYLIDGKLRLFYYHDGNYEDEDEMVIVNVPDELSEYFVSYVNEKGIKTNREA